jgi:hypothetical protein
MIGAEYLTARVLAALWQAADVAFDTELAQSKLSVQSFLKSRNAAWNLVGRVHFNLAENKKDETAPFAFLATYTTSRLLKNSVSTPIFSMFTMRANAGIGDYLHRRRDIAYLFASYLTPDRLIPLPPEFSECGRDCMQLPSTQKTIL